MVGQDGKVEEVGVRHRRIGSDCIPSMEKESFQKPQFKQRDKVRALRTMLKSVLLYMVLRHGPCHSKV